MNKFLEVLKNIKFAIEVFCEGLIYDITSINLTRTQIGLCVFAVLFIITSFIYPPIFVFTIATLLWLMCVATPIIIIGSLVFMASVYLIFISLESTKPYLWSLISGIIVITMICFGCYCIYDWILVEAFNVYGDIVKDIFTK